MAFKDDCFLLLKPYYFLNILLSLSYIIGRKTPGVCNYLFGTEQGCEFDGKETQILFFLMIVIMIRTRKTGSVSMISYLSSSFIYTKVANLILWCTADFVMGTVYAIVFILMGLLMPEPVYMVPDKVVYFNGLTTLTEEMNKDKRTVWLIAFYAVWNPSCCNFAPTFSRLSNQFGLENLKFGKIDIGRYPEAARTYRVSDSSYSKQLPTIILFKNGEEQDRRPIIDKKGKIITFSFSDENIRSGFDLKDLHETCKQELKSRKPKGSIKSKEE